VSEFAADIPWRPEAFTKTIDARRVAAEFADGATIVLQGLHHTWPPLARFCRALETELGHPAQANAYYTPRRSQGFGVHHDTHDVFVLQCSGEKRWLVYEPLLELPLKDQRYTPDLGETGPVTHDLTLRAGDMLYLPRGWLHEALTSDGDSLHVTVGVNVYTWLDAFRDAVESLADDVNFRRAPDGDADTLVEHLRERLSPDQVQRRLRSRFVRTRRAIADEPLSELRALDELAADSPVERRPTVIADLDDTTLTFEGRRVAFPAHAREEVEAVFAAEASFRAGDLPGELDEAGKLVVVRRLIREGFLRRTTAGA